MGRLAWIPVYASCAALAFLRAGPCSSQPTICIHPYWLEGWLLDYAQGFHRRGLLGAVGRLVWPGTVDIVALNALALALGVGLVIALAALLHRSAATPWARPAIAVLLATPVCSLLFEVLGDSLEIVLAGFVALSIALRQTESRAVRLAACAAFVLIAVAIHEAAIFLFAPAAVLLATRSDRPGRTSYLRFAALAAPLLAVTALDAGALPVDRDLRVVNSFTGAEISRMADPYPPFATLLREELSAATASPSAALEFATHVPRTWFVPCLALFLVAFAIWRDGKSLALWRSWFYLTVCSLPLYAIGHDWGRFSVLTFWIAIAATCTCAPTAESAVTRSRWASRLFPLPAPPAAAVFGVVSALLLAANAVSIDYRGTMLPRRSLLLVVPAAFAWYRWRRAVISP